LQVGGPTRPVKSEAAEGAVISDEKREWSKGKRDDRGIEQNQSYLEQALANKVGLDGLPSLADQVMGFANPVANETRKLLVTN